MISDLFTATVIMGIISSGIRLATPYLFAGIGEMFGQRSGVLNLPHDASVAARNVRTHQVFCTRPQTQRELCDLPPSE